MYDFLRFLLKVFEKHKQFFIIKQKDFGLSGDKAIYLANIVKMNNVVVHAPIYATGVMALPYLSIPEKNLMSTH